MDFKWYVGCPNKDSLLREILEALSRPTSGSQEIIRPRAAFQGLRKERLKDFSWLWKWLDIEIDMKGLVFG